MAAFAPRRVWVSLHLRRPHEHSGRVRGSRDRQCRGDRLGRHGATRPPLPRARREDRRGPLDERHEGTSRGYDLQHAVPGERGRAGGAHLRVERRQRLEPPAAHGQGRLEFQTVAAGIECRPPRRRRDGLHLAGRGESRQHHDGLGHRLQGRRLGRHHRHQRDLAAKGRDGRPGDAGRARREGLFCGRRRQGLRVRQGDGRTGRQASETARHDRPRQPARGGWKTLRLLDQRLARAGADERRSEDRQPDAFRREGRGHGLAHRQQRADLPDDRRTALLPRRQVSRFLIFRERSADAAAAGVGCDQGPRRRARLGAGGARRGADRCGRDAATESAAVRRCREVREGGFGRVHGDRRHHLGRRPLYRAGRQACRGTGHREGGLA